MGRSTAQIRIALVVLAAAAAAGCRDPAAEAPRPLAVTPDRGLVSQAVPVVIRGQNFHAKVTTDFAQPGESAIDARFVALLGPVPLLDVKLQSDGSLSATVPAGLPTGEHDLTVIDPDGRKGVLLAAYRVLADTDTSQLVASFRIDPIGPQQAGAPFTVTVTAVDAAGAVVSSFNGSALLTDLTGTAVPGSIGLFRNGVWTGSVEVRAPHAADVLTAGDGQGHTGTSVPFAVAPSPVAALQFATPARTSVAGQCSGAGQPVVVALLDTFGQPTQASQDVALSLGAVPPNGFQVFADDQCATPLAAPVVPAGAMSTTVWFRSTQAGAVSLSATAASLLPATQGETVLAGPPATLAFASTQQTVNAGGCSQPAVVEVRDAWGNPTPPGAASIALDVSPVSGVSFFSDSSCATAVGSVTVTPAGGTQAQFWFQGTIAQPVTITASAVSLGVPAASQDELILPEGSASRLVFLTPPRTAPAGSCSDLVTIQTQDSFGNAVAGAGAVQVSLFAAPGTGFAFYADDLCTQPAPGNVVQIGAGQSTGGFHFAGTYAGSAAWPVAVTAHESTLTDALQAETVTPAAPARVVFATAPQTVAAGACSGTTTLLLEDAYGNLTATGVPLDVLLAAPGLKFYSDPFCSGPEVAASTVIVPTGAGGVSFRFNGTQTGTVALAASPAGLAGATQSETIQAATPDRLVFTSAAQSVLAGACSGAATVEARDPFGNAAPVPAATPLNPSALPSAGFAFFSDASCTAPLGPLSILAGGTSASFFFQGTSAGSVTVAAGQASGLTAATQTETVSPAAADRVVFTTGPQSVAAGACAAAALQTRDPFGNASPVGAAIPVSLAAAPAAGFAFYSDPGCTAAVASVSLVAGASTAGFWFKGTASGSVTVTASSPPLASAAQVETVNPLPADRLVFLTAPQTKQAGACSAVATVQSQDSYGNASPVAAATPVSLSASPPAGFGFYSDAGCTAAVGSASIAAGASTAGFWFKGTVPGSVSVTAAAAGLTSAVQGATVVPAAADHLAFTTPPQMKEAGACSAVATIQSEDLYGNVSPVSAATPVSLSALPAAGFAFYSDAACTTSVGSVSIAAGASTAGFWFHGTVPGSVAVTAAAAGLTVAAQAETIAPAPADHIAFTTAPQTKQAGECSAAATVQTQDSYGNASPVAAATAVSLTASPAAAFGFYSDSYCTVSIGSVSIAAGASTAGFYFAGTAPGSVAVTAAAAGLTAAAQTETVVPASADRLVFTTGPQGLAAGACSAAAAIQSQDPYGNPSALAAGATVTLSASPAAGFAFYSNASCTASIGSVSIAAGASTAGFWFKGTAPGSVGVTASAAGLTAAAQTETVVPAPADRLAFTTAPQTKQAGECSAPVTVQARDPYGNPSALAAGATVTLSALPAAGFAFYSDPYCSVSIGSVSIAAGASTAGFYFAGTAPGSVAVTAAAAGLTAAAQTETVVPGAPDHLAFTTGPQTVAAGSCSAGVTVQSRDASGNASPVAAATPVSLMAAPAAGFAFYSDSGCSSAVASVSIAAGASAAGFWFKGTPTASVTVTAAAAGLSPSPTQVETVNPAPPDRVVYTTAPQSATSGQCSSPVTLQARDPYGNASAVAGATAVTLTASPAAGFTFFAGPGCAGAPVGAVTLAAGSSTVTFSFTGTTGGSPTAVTVTAAPAGLTAAAQPETINPAGTPTQLVFTTPPRTASAGACSGQLTVEAQDSSGTARPVAAATAVNLSAVPASGFTFYSDAGCTAAAGSVSIAQDGTTTSFWFKGTAAGNVDVTAAAAGLTSATQAETVSPAAPSALVFTTAPQTRQAGACSAVATVQTQDPFGNVAPVGAATPVTLSSAPAGLGFYSDSGCTVPAGTVSIAAGASTVNFWFKGTSVGGPVVTAAKAGLTSATQTETINPAGASVLVFATAVQTRQAGVCSAAATVQSQDSYGNVSPVGAATQVDLSAAPAAGFTFYSDAGCATTATFVSMAAGASTASFWFKGTAPGSVAVSASATGFTSANQTETITPAAAHHLAFTTAPQTRQAGACSAAATVQAQDAFNNPFPEAAATPVTLSSAPAGLGFYSDAGCTVPAGTVSIAAGASTVNFWFKGTSVGSPLVTAASAGLTSATQTETINPAGASVLVFASAPQTRQAGLCSAAATIQSQDSYGNVSPVGAATTVNLSAAPAAGFTFYSDAGCVTTATSVSMAAGASTAGFWFMGTAPGSVTVTALATGFASATQGETVNPAPANHLAFTTGPQARQAGQCSGVATVQSQDPYANPSPVAAATTVNLSAAPAPGFTFYSDAGCTAAVTTRTIAAGSSAASFYFKGTAVASVVVTAAAAGLTPATQTETVSPAGASVLVFATAPQTRQAGACSAVATVQSQDTYGNVSPVAAATTVNLSAVPAASFAFYSDAGCTAAVGSVSIAAGASTTGFWFRGTAPGSITVTASAGGFTSAAQGETVTPAPPDHLVFATGPQTRQAGACSAVATVQTQDPYNNVSPVGAATPVNLTASPAAGFTFYSDAGCTVAVASVSIAAGASTAGFWFKGTAPGSVTVTASAAGLTAAAQVETVNPAPPDHLVFATGPLTAAAGSCSAVATLQSRDPYGNVSPVGAATTENLTASPATGFTFYSNAGCTVAAGSVSIAAGTSAASFWFKGTAAGSVTVTASAAGMSPNPTQLETVSPAAPDRLIFTTTPQTRQAGACSAVATLQSQDPYGNVAPVGAATVASLTAVPATGFTYYSDGACATPATTATFAAGASTASFWFRGTVAGSVAATAAVSGWTASATQTETVTPGSTDHLAWDPIPSPQAQDVAFGVTVRALDLYGNATPSFAGTATLSITPARPLTCASGCTSGLTTGAFAAGIWTGSMSVGGGATGATLTAISGAIAGTSAAFDVQGAASSSPPTARFTATPLVIRQNQTVTFDATASSDYQTPAALLQVSWDFLGTSTGAPAYPTPAAPWTAWTTTRTASNTYPAAGTYTVRLAVRDNAGDIGYATVTVVVLATGATNVCIVNTSADVNDGATSCTNSAQFGTDGRLSLVEALAIAADGWTIYFASPMTITGSGSYIVQRKVKIVAQPGVVLDTKSLSITGGDAGTPVSITGLEMTRLATPVDIQNKKGLTLQDVYLHDGAGIVDKGTLTLTRVRMARCTTQCVEVTDASGADTLRVRYSDFRGTAGTVGLQFSQCAAGKLALVAQSNAFSGFQTAIVQDNNCTGFTQILANTFEANGTGVTYLAGNNSPNHVLQNNVFTNQSVAAVNCGGGNATFATRNYHQLFQNASAGCIGADPFTLSPQDPYYVFPAAADYRLQPVIPAGQPGAGTKNPAVDSAFDAGTLYFLPAYPATNPRFLGLGPDRGGRETY